jgi:uncharacterized protein YbjT (DUF2867 family)
MIAIIGASGLLGSATLDALLSHRLAKPDSIIAITSSGPDSRTWKRLSDKGVRVRHGNFEDAASLEAALKGVTKFFLISSPCAEMDFNDAPEGQGRERHHMVAIDAARAAGVEHILYTSLAFGIPSKAGVMRAHIRTEKYLATLDDIKITIAREGLYSQSWPLYFGYYDINTDPRTVVRVAGDGKVCWTDLGDLGLAYALILTDPSEDWAGKTFYLSAPATNAKTLHEVAELVSQVRKMPVKVEVVGREAHVKCYVEEMQMDPASVEWWVGTFEAIADKETLIDDPTLFKLLERQGKNPITMEEIVTGHNPLYDAISDLKAQGPK